MLCSSTSMVEVAASPLCRPADRNADQVASYKLSLLLHTVHLHVKRARLAKRAAY